MQLMKWSDRYSVGVARIDAQHMELFRIVNELYEAMSKGDPGAVAGGLLQRLVRYTKEHFAAEEAMMASAKYPGLATHRQIHAALVKKVEDLIARHEQHDARVYIELLNFLSEWLKKHIQQEDKEYSPCLVQHGAK